MTNPPAPPSLKALTNHETRSRLRILLRDVHDSYVTLES